MPLCAGMHNARWKQGKSLDERREFQRFFLGKVLDKKHMLLRGNTYPAKPSGITSPKPKGILEISPGSKVQS